MPLFEYRCTSCGKVSEFLELPGNSQEKRCKTCGNAEMEKVFSSFGVKSAAGASCESGACNLNACNLPSCSSGSCSLSG